MNWAVSVLTFHLSRFSLYGVATRTSAFIPQLLTLEPWGVAPWSIWSFGKTCPSVYYLSFGSHTARLLVTTIKFQKKLNVKSLGSYNFIFGVEIQECAKSKGYLIILQKYHIQATLRKLEQPSVLVFCLRVTTYCNWESCSCETGL